MMHTSLERNTPPLEVEVSPKAAPALTAPRALQPNAQLVEGASLARKDLSVTSIWRTSHYQISKPDS